MISSFASLAETPNQHIADRLLGNIRQGSGRFAETGEGTNANRLAVNGGAILERRAEQTSLAEETSGPARAGPLVSAVQAGS